MKLYLKIVITVILILYSLSSSTLNLDKTLTQLVPYKPESKDFYKKLESLLSSKETKYKFVGIIASLDLLTYATVKDDESIKNNIKKLINDKETFLKELKKLENSSVSSLIKGYKDFINILYKYPKLTEKDRFNLFRLAQTERAYTMQSRILLFGYIKDSIKTEKELFNFLYNVGCIGESCNSTKDRIISNMEKLLRLLKETEKVINNEPLCQLSKEIIKNAKSTINGQKLYLPPLKHNLTSIVKVEEKFPIFEEEIKEIVMPNSNHFIILTKNFLYFIESPLLTIEKTSLKLIPEETKLIKKISLPSKFKAIPKSLKELKELIEALKEKEINVIVLNDTPLITTSRILYTIKDSKLSPLLLFMDKKGNYKYIRVEYKNILKEKIPKGTEIKIAYGGYFIKGLPGLGKIKINRLKSGNYNYKELKTILEGKIKDIKRIVVKGMPELPSQAINGVVKALDELKYKESLVIALP